MVKINYKDIKDIYKIDEYGNIYSEYKKGFLKPKKDKDGYLRVMLRTQKGSIEVGIATLVIYNFIGEPPTEIKDPTVDHIDGNIENNFYKNLRWLERSENSSIRKERARSLGELNHEAKLNEQQVIEICQLLTDNKLSLQEIANIYKVHKSTISNIKRQVKWTHISKKYKFPRIEIKRDEKGRFYRGV